MHLKNRYYIFNVLDFSFIYELQTSNSHCRITLIIHVWCVDPLLLKSLLFLNLFPITRYIFHILLLYHQCLGTTPVSLRILDRIRWVEFVVHLIPNYSEIQFPVDTFETFVVRYIFSLYVVCHHCIIQFSEMLYMYNIHPRHSSNMWPSKNKLLS